MKATAAAEAQLYDRVSGMAGEEAEAAARWGAARGQRGSRECGDKDDAAQWWQVAASGGGLEAFACNRRTCSSQSSRRTGGRRRSW
eukprot:5530629-Pleurochrysis_carterae.AAC.2